MLETPVIFITFNRPDLTQRVFNAIREAQPKQLFMIADGPRYPEEMEKCQKARDVINQVDWNCEVYKNYSDVNLGCRKRIASGINWAFEKVEEAIILEDDCLPHSSFFRYCQELLDYYSQDERIWCISGNNFQNGVWRGDGSYYFSNYNHCWGWATWRRAWQHYDQDLSNWPKFRDGNYLKNILDSELEIKYWEGIFENLYTFGKPNSWAYPWTFTCWQNNGLTILPNVNLVSNIGFRDDGTHTTQQESRFSNLPIEDIGQINHPSFVNRHKEADIKTFKNNFYQNINNITKIKNKLIKTIKSFKQIKTKNN